MRRPPALGAPRTLRVRHPDRSGQPQNAPGGLAVALLLAVLLATGTGALAVPSGAEGPGTETGEPDPWVGKPADEIRALLGDPMKRRERDGGEVTWTYRLFRVEDPSAMTDAASLIDLPGVGLVARTDSPGPDGHPTIGPTEIDREGRALPRDGQSVSVTWSRDVATGEVERTSPPRRSKGLGRKVKLRFELDADRRVTDWSVSPPPRGEGQREKPAGR